MPVPFTAVTIDDVFWTPRLEANRERTIPIEYDQCKMTGRIDALRLEWEPGQKEPHFFCDSDVAKWIEAAAYSLATRPDPTESIAAVLSMPARCEPRDIIANRLDPWHGAWFHPYAL